MLRLYFSNGFLKFHLLVNEPRITERWRHLTQLLNKRYSCTAVKRRAVLRVVLYEAGDGG